MVEPRPIPKPPSMGSFSTAQIPVNDRMEYWESHNTKALIGLDIRTLEDSPLEAKEINLYFHSLRFAGVKGTSQLVERSKRIISEHPTGDMAIFFAITGEAFFHHSKGTILLRPGQAVLYDADRPFVRGFSSGLRELVLTIPHEDYVHLSHGKIPTEPIVFNFGAKGGAMGEDSSAAKLVSLINFSLRNPRDDMYWVEQETFVLLERLIARAEGSDRNSAYRSAIQEIERRFEDRSLNRSQVAAAAAVSERQMSRLFASRGETFTEYLQAHRLKAAEALLISEPQSPIGEIARRSGFASASHFARIFKARTGKAPSELQRTNGTQTAPYLP